MTPEWEDVKRWIERKRESALKELLGCDLERVERIRGQIEAYDALLRLPSTVSKVDAEWGDT